MLSLNTNSVSLFTQSNMAHTQRGLSVSMTRMGTGFRVNSAMDDAAGLQIATRMESDSRGMQAAMKNAQNGISMLQTAEGSLSEVTNIVLRMKELATEGASTGSSSDNDRAAMQAEFDQLGAELGNIIRGTTYGGATLLDGAASDGKLTAALTFQIGSTAVETMGVNVSGKLAAIVASAKALSAKYEGGSDKAVDTAISAKVSGAVNGDPAKATQVKTDAIAAAKTAIAAGKSAADIATDIETAVKTADTTITDAGKLTAIATAVIAFVKPGSEIGKVATISNINDMLSSVTALRSDLGANAKRLEHVYNNQSNIDDNTVVARSRIMDTDYAKESASMSSLQMLMQASTSMLKQSGMLNQLALSLMQ